MLSDTWSVAFDVLVALGAVAAVVSALIMLNKVSDEEWLKAKVRVRVIGSRLLDVSIGMAVGVFCWWWTSLTEPVSRTEVLFAALIPFLVLLRIIFLILKVLSIDASIRQERMRVSSGEDNINTP